MKNDVVLLFDLQAFKSDKIRRIIIEYFDLRELLLSGLRAIRKKRRNSLTLNYAFTFWNIVTTELNNKVKWNKKNVREIITLTYYKIILTGVEARRLVLFIKPHKIACKASHFYPRIINFFLFFYEEINTSRITML